MEHALDSSPATPHFKRVLTRRDLVLYGLAILTPTAAFPIFGIVQTASRGHAALSYLVAMVAMLFTAASYGKMAGAYPVAGSTYTYAQRALNPHIGFLAGWAMLLDYFLIPLLSVIYPALTAKRLFPAIPYGVWVVLITIGITVVNIRGIRVTARASGLMTLIMCIGAALFAALAAARVVKTSGAAGLVSSEVFFRPETFALSPLMLGAALAALSYIGFDAISTLAEDTIRPEKDISFATVLVCVLQTVFCVGTVYLAALVWPDYRTLPDVETGILDVSKLAGGALLFGVVMFVLVVAGLASALAGQAGASRLLFGMGRDGIVSRRIFAHLDPRYSTPTRSIYLMGAISMAGSLFLRFQLVTELLNFGAFVGFILVNLSVIRHYYVRLGRRKGWDFVTNLVFPLLGALVSGYVWMNLTNMAKLVGFAWLGVGVVYLAVLTRGFRVPPKSLGNLTEGAGDAC